MFIERIITSQRDGLACFVVRFELQGKAIDVACDAATILDYASFQRHVLAQTGSVFILEVAEGREPAMAEFFWHRELDYLLRVEARKAADAAMHN